jgi:broad specificity phosphatase PhoE
MANLLLVRHGQASLGAENYDQLSALGAEQSKLLGQHFRDIGCTPTRFLSGSLNRHIQTLTAITQGFSGADSLSHSPEFLREPAWNEFEFKTLIKTYLEHFPSESKLDTKRSPAYFFSILKKAMLAWSEANDLIYGGESWAEFEHRVSTSLKQIHKSSDKDDTIVLVSSGGAISMALKYVLKLSASQMIDMNFQIRNSSITHLELKKDRIVLAGFNQLPHLETASNKHLISYA